MEEDRERQRVWVAATEPPNQAVLSTTFRQAGFQVERVDSPVDLRTQLAYASPDLLVLDRGMLSAMLEELFERFHAGAELPALMAVSDQWPASDLARARALGAEPVRQPVQAQRLLQTVSRLLASRPKGRLPLRDLLDVLVCGFGAHAAVIAEELERAGYRVRSVAEGGVAEPLWCTGGYRVLLLDLQVPGLERMVGGAEGRPIRRPVVAV